MTAVARALRLPRLRTDGLLIALAGTLLAILLGATVAAGLWLYAAAFAAVVTAFVIGLINWRWSLYGLFAYLPVSGILTLALYPDTGPGALAKDFLFVLPAYAGFFGAHWARRRQVSFPGAPTGVLILLGVLVVAGAFNPALEDPLIGLIGIKVWLMYLPMIYLGYHLLRSFDDLARVLKVIVITGAIPAVVGIFEAILIYTGNADFVYRLYGDAAADATQGFAVIPIGPGELRRIPSTFSFLTQYYVYLAVMIAACYAWWRLRDGRSPGTAVRVGFLALALIAAFTSGARGAFVFMPLLLGMILVLDRRVGARAAGLIMAGSLSLIVAVGLIGTSVTALPGHLWDNASFQFEIITGGFDDTLEHAFAGKGTGYDTGASRYVTGEPPSTGDASQGYKESWWLKSVLELGLAGLVLSLILFATILGRGLGIHRRISDSGLRATSAALIGLLAWAVIYNFKAQLIDIDPLNVYFWLFAGFIFRLPALDRERARERSRSGPLPERSRASSTRSSRPRLRAAAL